MLSFKDKLNAEIARRDAAMRKAKYHVSEIADIAGGTYQDVKTSLKPKNIVEGLKSEYDPKKVVVGHPWGSVLTALAAGFVVVPLVRSAIGMIPPKPPPQHVVIEVAGAGKPVQAKAKEPGFMDSIMEIVAMMGGIKGILAKLSPQTHDGMADFEPSSVAASNPAPQTPSATISRRYAPPPPEN